MSTSIQPRDLRFDLTDVPPAWHGGQLSVSLFFDALSVFFPVGERFFVRSVKAFREDLARSDVGLQADVAAFCAQEGHHGREHDRYNDMLRARGLPVDALERHVARLLTSTAAFLSKRGHLAITCALEHFTALLGILVLEDPKSLEGAHPTMAALWRWHSAEENEHKAVAYDVYRAVHGRWFTRVAVMALITCTFWMNVVLFYAVFAWRSRILFNVREQAALVRYLFGGDQGLHSIGRPYVRYYARDFHPNEIASGHLVEAWKATAPA